MLCVGGLCTQCRTGERTAGPDFRSYTGPVGHRLPESGHAHDSTGSGLWVPGMFYLPQIRAKQDWLFGMLSEYTVFASCSCEFLPATYVVLWLIVSWAFNQPNTSQSLWNACVVYTLKSIFTQLFIHPAYTVAAPCLSPARLQALPHICILHIRCM